MSLFAQTVAGKFDTADILFLFAFIVAALAVVIDIADGAKYGRPATILIRVAVALMACAFWLS